MWNDSSWKYSVHLSLSSPMIHCGIDHPNGESTLYVCNWLLQCAEFMIDQYKQHRFAGVQMNEFNSNK